MRADFPVVADLMREKVARVLRGRPELPMVPVLLMFYLAVPVEEWVTWVKRRREVEPLK